MLSNETMHEYNLLQHRLDTLETTYEETLAQGKHTRATTLYSRILEVEYRLSELATPELTWLWEYQNSVA